MIWLLNASAARFRVLCTRLLTRFGFRDDTFLLFLAILVGLVTAAAAVGFHELIGLIRDSIYTRADPRFMYGKGVWLLIAVPALGGLIVGLVGRYVVRAREGRGIIDVMETVVRSGGAVKPSIAIEKIFTSAVTIGTGGSAGAEGPIVQIGAAISSGIGQLFSITRSQMTLLIGCGAAAGISAIFNAPIGGVLFALEVILLDFSLRTFTPVVLASVVSNVTTQWIFHRIEKSPYEAIFQVPNDQLFKGFEMSWATAGNFLFLGLLCGMIGVALTRMMDWSERRSAALRLPEAIKPAIGGALLGATGVIYVMVFGWWIMGQPKPIGFDTYPLPAYFSDGYPVVRRLLDPGFYTEHADKVGLIILLLGTLCFLKLGGTILSLGSGGSGGIIAPSLFLGATAGAALSLILRKLGIATSIPPAMFAMIGMGAVLAAVIHAPLASILILMELRRESQIVLPAMICTITATGFARVLFRDSIYTLSLRHRGVRVGSMADLSLLRRMCVEQVPLDPASVITQSESLSVMLERVQNHDTAAFVVNDDEGNYVGMISPEDIKTALLEREAIPLLLAQDLQRTTVPMVKVTDDLAGVLDIFDRHDVDRLPVCLREGSGRVIGWITRAALMKRYQKGLEEN